MTNSEKIRVMNDEELARFFQNLALVISANSLIKGSTGAVQITILFA